MTLFLSRLRLSGSPSARALDGLINPDDPGRRMDAHHRLLWAAFSDSGDRRRDFLWRAGDRGDFLTLSARAPQQGDLFERPEVKQFAPRLDAGDRLHFTLRANATRDRKGKGRVDVVMDALHAVPQSERALRRLAVASDQGRVWLQEQGARSGFRLLGHGERSSVTVTDYSVVPIPDYRGRRERQPQFGILDMSGTIEVTEPSIFLARLATGFGRARAFGCGLMLIRRAQ